MRPPSCVLGPRELLPFLILRAMAEHRHSALASLLLAHHSMCAARRHAPFVATERHVKSAQRQHAALVSLGIHTVLTSRLPTFWQAVRPLPAALFVRGQAGLLHRRGVAIIGSRAASPAPLAWAQQEARRRARGGELVVSGGAAGIDAAAHRGALEASGLTLAYLGSCIDQPYPANNLALLRQIVEAGGALVSEHPPLSATRPYHHALRNRLIAAQASLVIVVEASARSGTLGTATYARRLGRHVVVSPPQIGGQRSGIDGLLQSGHARQMVPGAAAAGGAI